MFYYVVVNYATRSVTNNVAFADVKVNTGSTKMTNNNNGVLQHYSHTAVHFE